MKYFWDFVEFLTMMELKQHDSIVRNYTIETDRRRRAIQPNLRNDFVRLGLLRIGLEVTNATAHTSWSELLAALRGIGCTIHEVLIMAYVAQFYNYHRIKKGELHRWPKKLTHKSL